MNITKMTKHLTRKGDRVRVDTAAYSTLPNPIMGTIERATWLAQTEMYGLTIVMDSGRRFRLWLYFDEITVLPESEQARDTRLQNAIDDAFTVVSNKDIGKELARVTAERDMLQAQLDRICRAMEGRQNA